MDDELDWLRRNAGLRMDANLPMFQKERAAFHKARYEFAAARVGGMVALDCACGLGYGSAILARSALSVTGVDSDERAVAYAHRTYPGPRFICADAGRTGLAPGSFDAVVSFETLEHVPDDGAALAEFHRVLKPGGLLICSVPNRWGVGGYHVRDYSRESLLDALDPMFTDVRLRNQNSGTGWAHNHRQSAGIVQTTAENADLAECLIAVARRRDDL